MAFAPGYRLGLILEPDGEIRSVVEASGIGGFDEAAFVGQPVGGAAAGGVRGEARRAAWEERIAAAHSSAQPVRYSDLRPDAPEGSAAVVVTTVTGVRAHDGTVEAILVAVHDRSEFVEIERDAYEQRELLRSALEVTGMGSFALYIREPRFESDARYREIFGYDPGPAVLDRGVAALSDPLHLDDRDRVQATFMAAMRGEAGVNYQEEYRIWAVRPDGAPELRRVTALGRVEVDEHGPRRILGVIDDVTDRRREDELRIRMQKREALGTLAGGMAHDFNNVISAILSNASVASAELSAGADPSTSIDEIARGAKRAGDLVRRMLDFSRDQAPERRAFDLGEVARDATELLRPTLPRTVDLRLHVAPNLPELQGDSSQLHQVVMNLVTNAGQALVGGRGWIEVSVGAATVIAGGGSGVEAGDYLRLKVADGGRGIPEDDLRRIFDPFFTTKSQGEGTGLGLSAAQSIVRGHGGQITVDSLVGEGTTITVLLPRSAAGRGAAKRGPGGQGRPAPSLADGSAKASAPDPTAAPDPPAAADPPAAPDAPSRPRVLFVDDERALVMLAERALPHHGCEVHAFTEPEEALAAIRADPAAFDALVTDLAMPCLTGFELIAGAREVRPDLPVVLTSGFLTDDSKAEAERLAVDRVVPKPCPIDELASAVLALTARARTT